jgi:CMP-N,N'-diacetyllegionaminic acid synthase
VFKKNKFLLFIPARGGSKGIPNKNLKKIKKKTLVEITINFSSSLKYVDEIILSSDSEKILEIGKKNKIQVIKRPKKLSSDLSTTEEAILHALNFYKQKGIFFDYTVILEPTSPLRKITTVEKAIRKIVQKKSESLVSVSEINSSFGTINNEFYKTISFNNARRRQDRKIIYSETGVVYIIKNDSFVLRKKIPSKNWLSLTVDQIEGMDINSKKDLNLVKKISSLY